MDVIAKNIRGMNKRYRVPGGCIQGGVGGGGSMLWEEEAQKRKESQLTAREPWKLTAVCTIICLGPPPWEMIVRFCST